MNEDIKQIEKKSSGFIKRLIDFLKTPSSRYSVLFISVVSIVLWDGFGLALDATNTEEFCISCHEMNDFVYQEFKDTVHYTNRTGVRTTCPDCHVPQEWSHKMIRKIQASNELWYTVLGSIDTPEKFEAKRLEMARHVWASMEQSNSRECTGCHDNLSMEYNEQEGLGVEAHSKDFGKGWTCISCHRGIAHSLPVLAEDNPVAVADSR